MNKLVNFVNKYMGIVGTIAMILSYVPQLHLTYTTQNVSGQSLSFWVLLNIGLAISTFKSYQAYNNNKNNATLSLLGFQLPNLLLALAMLIAVIIFK